VPDPLLVEHRDGVAVLTLNRPQALNALTLELKTALLAALTEARDDPTVRAVVLAGSGAGFCAGQDLREHVALLDAGDPAPLHTVREHYNPLALAVAELPKPVLAAVRGMAAGAGAALAFACDLRVGGPGTRFLLAFANVGLAADSGASWTLPRLVGLGRATSMMLLAEPVGAAEAERIGLLTRLVDDDGAVLPTTLQLAARLAAGPTLAYAQIKRELRVAAAATLADALETEADAQAAAGATEDHRASTAAFVAKQRPTFTAR